MQLKHNGRTLDVATGPMVVGRDCALPTCCWVVAQGAHASVSDGVRRLESIKAKDLVKYYARGKSLTYHRAPNLFDPGVLRVLHTVDPDSFFYAYVSPEGTLIATEVPARLGRFLCTFLRLVYIC